MDDSLDVHSRSLSASLERYFGRAFVAPEVID